MESSVQIRVGKKYSMKIILSMAMFKLERYLEFELC